MMRYVMTVGFSVPMKSLILIVSKATRVSGASAS